MGVGDTVTHNSTSFRLIVVEVIYCCSTWAEADPSLPFAGRANVAAVLTLSCSSSSSMHRDFSSKLAAFAVLQTKA